MVEIRNNGGQLSSGGAVLECCIVRPYCTAVLWRIVRLYCSVFTGGAYATVRTGGPAGDFV